MSLKYLNEAIGGHSGESQEKARKDYDYEWIGETNNPTAHSDEILSSALCPKPGNKDPYVRGNYLTNVRAVRDENLTTLWHVFAKSSTEYDKDTDVNPLDEPADIEWDEEQIDDYTFVDADDVPITNTAGDLIPQPRENSRWVISVSKNLAKVPLVLAHFNNKINKDAFTIDGVTFPKQTLMCKGLKISKTQRVIYQSQQVSYRSVSYRLHHYPDGFVTKVPNVGFQELVEVPKARIRNLSSGRRIYVRDKKTKEILYKMVKTKATIWRGEPPAPVTEAWPLDKKGVALPEDYKTEDIIFLDKIIPKSVTFNNLPR